MIIPYYEHTCFKQVDSVTVLVWY